MSTLAAVCADEYYRKPEDADYWFNKLKEKRISKDYSNIWFEMPYHVWCLHCNTKIAKGVWFNAVKTEIGKYLSTPILKFQMTCWSCKGLIEIETDPKITDYTIKSGAKRQYE